MQDQAVTAEGCGVGIVAVSRRVPSFAVLLLLFAISGATALVDQLCFSKYLIYIVGSTAHAVSAVLAAFMTGLAIGAHWGGKYAAKVRSQLVAYGILELVVAAAVVVTPFAFEFLTPIYATLARKLPNSLAVISAFRWCMALGLVVIPTMAMGATLPLLAQSLGTTSNADSNRARLTQLYGINTFGGALGALSAAYLALPALGLDGTLFASAALSGAIGLAAIALGRHTSADTTLHSKATQPSEQAAQAEQVNAQEARLIYLLAFSSGCLVFASEVIFTHLLALLIGNSAYAFGLILAIFLLCLFRGAQRADSATRRFAESALPLTLSWAALALAATLPLWERLPGWFQDAPPTFAGREIMRGIAALAVLFIPTTLMGLTFPLLLLRVSNSPNVGRWVGRLTAVNTAGAVVGSLATGYVVLPRLGSQWSLLAVAFAFVAAALAVVRWSKGRHRVLVLGAGALTILLTAVCPRWDLNRLTNGANVYFETRDTSTDQILYVKEDAHGGVTSVARSSDNVLTLYTNGKFQGDNGPEMHAQRLFAHYPSLFVKHFDRSLVIGLGTGTTLGTVAAYPWREIGVAEISPSILETAKLYFSDVNHNALADPRVTVHLEDGRNHLLVNETKYNLISMELSSIWFAGAASLYSQEFYRLARERLTTDGVLQQWVQLHHVTRRDFATILNTLRREFAHVALFYGGRQGILVASAQPLSASMARAEHLDKNANVASTFHVKRPLISLLDDVLLVDEGLDYFISDSVREAGTSAERMVSTDRNLYLDYATPRGNILPWSSREELVATLLSYSNPQNVSALRVP